ncbi:MAG: N-acetyl-alpha-D-glucosaminyl L-malate synthase BshA [Nanoarchaeota archaeon]|nr:N-acetyl-alpha-D-glucosaminyl L-malate synthase BshA [Nanoarchaeota archaeon]MBU1623162.1 N-acetyl-alpha-D-glucosaminyl L-malate synthase BshA [Nanoarchaeota archaeon]
MKIGIVGYPSVGGSGFVASSVALELSKRNHEVHFFSFDCPYLLRNSESDNLRVHVVNCDQYPLFKYPDYTTHLANKLIEVSAENGLDVMNVHYAIPHAVSAYLAKQITGVPYVVTLHGTEVHTLGDKKEFKPVLEKMIADADAVTAVCDFLAKEASRIWNVDGIRTIKNFIDYQNLSEVEREAKVDLSRPSLVHVSNYRSIKRVNDLVEGMIYILDEIPSAKLNLIGDGPELPNLNSRICELGLENSIKCWGFQDNLSPFFRFSDLFVLSSDMEGAPLTFLEAMFYGLPIVASDVGGVNELVLNGITGYTFERGNIKDYAQRVIQILKDDQKHQCMRSEAKSFVMKNHLPETIMPQYEQLFEEVALR